MATGCLAIPSATIIDLQAGMKYLRMHSTRKSPPRPLPGRSTARYWAVQASKQSQSMHFQYTRSIHLWTNPTSTQLQITSMHMQPTSSSVNCFLPPEFARPPSLHHFQVIHSTQLLLHLCLSCPSHCSYIALLVETARAVANHERTGHKTRVL